MDRAVGQMGAGPQQEHRIDPGRLAQALRDNALAIALVVTGLTLCTYAIASSAAKRYRATARIAASAAPHTSPQDEVRWLRTQVALVKGAPVLAAAAAKLPGESRSSLAGKVTTAIAPDADLIEITAHDHDARGAAAIANAVAAAFLSRRAENRRAAIAQSQGALEAQIAPLVAMPDRAPEVAALRARVDELVVAAAGAGTDLQLVQPAQAPARPYAPRPLRAAAGAFLAALVAAVLIVALREYRRLAASRREVARLAGVPLLAALPAYPPVSPWDRGLEALEARAPSRLRELMAGVAARRRGAQAARREQVRAVAEDGLRSLLAATLLTLPPGARHVILVTSPGRGRHSAQVAAGLAQGLARAGEETLVLSSDVASPQLADALGVPAGPGLVQALEQARTGTAVRLRATRVPGLDSLHVVPGGGRPDDGIGLVRPGVVDALFGALRDAGYDYIVVDAPGLLVAPEGCLVARAADAAILACPEECSPEEADEARRALERLDVRLLGAVTLPAGAAEEPAGESPRLPR